MNKNSIIGGFASIFGLNKKNDYKSLIRKHWKKTPGADDSEKLYCFIEKHHLNQRESAKLLNVSTALICKILSKEKTPGIKFLIKVYEYDLNPKPFVHVCRLCKKEFDRKKQEWLCPECREYRTKIANQRLKPKEYVCQSCFKTIYQSTKRKYCDDCRKPTNRRNLYFSFMK